MSPSSKRAKTSKKTPSLELVDSDDDSDHQTIHRGISIASHEPYVEGVPSFPPFDREYHWRTLQPDEVIDFESLRNNLDSLVEQCAALMNSLGQARVQLEVVKAERDKYKDFYDLTSNYHQTMQSLNAGLITQAAMPEHRPVSMSEPYRFQNLQ